MAAWAAFAFNLIIFIGGGSWKAARMESSLQHGFTQALTAHRREIDDELDRVRREFGEGLTALRQKTVEIELYTRDTFVRRESFLEATKGMNEAVRTLSDRLDAKLEKLDAKLERLGEHPPRRDRA